MYRIFFAVLGLLSVLLILIKVRKNKFSEGRSIFWVTGGIIMFFLSIFPKTIDKLSSFLGIYHPPSLLFLLVSLFIIYTVFKLEEEITQTREQMKDLAHRNAILETRLREKFK